MLGDEFYTRIPLDSVYNDSNAVAVGMADGLLAAQNTAMANAAKELQKRLSYGNVSQFMNTPGFPMGLNPIDCLNSVSLANALTGGGFNFNFPAFGSGLNGINWGDYWKNLGGTGSSSSSSSGTGSIEQQRCDKLKPLLEKVAEAMKDKDFVINFDEYNKAEGDAAKLEALKKIYKQVLANGTAKQKLQEAILGEEEYKKVLDEIGYNENSTFRDFVSGLKSKDVHEYMSMASEPDEILGMLTEWNKQNKSKSVIKHLTEKFKSAKSDEKEKYVEPIKTIANALITKAKSVKGDKLEKAAEKLDKLVDELTVSNLASKSAELVKQFDNLYIQTKLTRAEQLSADIEGKYKFLNDLSDSDSDKIINSDLVAKNVKTQLINAEGMNSSKVNEIDGKKDRTQADVTINNIDDLISNNKIKELTPAIDDYDIYVSNDGFSGGTKYYVKEDGNLYELEGVKAIKDGKFVYHNGYKGSKTANIDTKIQDALSKTSTDLESVKKYSDALSDLKSIAGSNKLLTIGKLNGKPVAFDPPVFAIAEKNQYGGNYRYFSIVNNELKEINVHSIIVKDGKVHYKSSANADSKLFNDNKGSLYVSPGSSADDSESIDESSESSSSSKVSTKDVKSTVLKKAVEDSDYQKVGRIFFEAVLAKNSSLMKECMGVMDENNIIDIVRGYYERANHGNSDWNTGWFNSGFFENIKNKDAGFTNGDLVHVLGLLLKAMKNDNDMKEGNSSEIAKLDELLNRYEGYSKSDKLKDDSWFAKMFGRNDLDNIDDYIEDILDINAW